MDHVSDNNSRGGLGIDWWREFRTDGVSGLAGRGTAGTQITTEYSNASDDIGYDNEPRRIPFTGR
jgi:hypothetical protein